MAKLMIDGKKVLHRLVDMGKSKADLARAIHVDYSMIHRVIDGEKMLGAEKLYDMAEFLGMTMNDIVVKTKAKEGA